MGEKNNDIRRKDRIAAANCAENIPVSARGFKDAETATRFAHVLAHVVRVVSRYIDLSRLDGITIAYDYDVALAALDRGYEGHGH